MQAALQLVLPAKKITVEIFFASYLAFVPYIQRLANQFVIITDENVKDLYGQELQKILNAVLIAIPAGEMSKTRANKEKIEDLMFAKKCGKDTCVIAIGGGVVTDIAGFASATYCRGIPFVSIPTTLLAMVDASIGGKTGANLPSLKNYIGAIYQPKAIIIDYKFLETLSDHEWRNGVAEMIKYGLIKSITLFEKFEKTTKKCEILALIKECCEIKCSVVQADVNEEGFRRILNFGHTIGHAIESLENYQISHGDAIALVMIGESYIAHKLGYIDMNTFRRIKNIFHLHEFPLKLTKRFEKKKAISVMKQDKKALSSKIRFALIESIGSMHTFNGEYCKSIDDSLLYETLQMMKREFSNGEI